MLDQKKPFESEIKNNRAPNNNAGGGGVYIEPGAGAGIGSIAGWFAEFFERPKNAGFFVTEGLDKQRDPPQWMEDKDVTVLGLKQSKAARGDTWWEKKYARELAIADLRLRHRDEDFTYEKHDIMGAVRTVMRWAGIGTEPLRPSDYTKAGEREYLEKLAQEKQVEEENAKRNWRGFMQEAMETDKPLATLAMKYRNVYDVYGLDQYLDGPAAFIWLNCKVGCLIGVCHGGWRALKLLHVDAHFLQISGIGVLAFLNTSIVASMVKWAGNTTLCASMFIVGDKATTGIKTLVYSARAPAVTLDTPPAERALRAAERKHALQRSPINYSVGLACAFGIAGVLPWWMLGDVALGLRFTAAGASVGGVLGWAVGLLINNLIAVNLGRLNFTPHQFRSYQSMLKVERIAFDHEVERRRRLEDIVADGTHMKG